MKELHTTRGKLILVDDGDFETLSRISWYSSDSRRTYYAVRSKVVDGVQIHGTMHGDIMTPPPGFMVDHIDGCGWNNQRSNLRICTRSQNASNTRRKLPKSGFRGVSRQVTSRRFCAKINKNKVLTVIGYFDTPEEAARAYDAEAKKQHGEFASLNFDP